MASRNEKTMSFNMASDTALIHPVLKLSEKFVKECGAGEAGKTTLVLRELLFNAVVHGNRDAVQRSVNCEVECLNPGQFRVVVEDQGPGFNFESLDTRLPEDPRRIRNRGYTLLRNICKEIQFNEKGNRVTAFVSELE